MKNAGLLMGETMATSGADVVGNCTGTAVEFIDRFDGHMAAYSE